MTRKNYNSIATAFGLDMRLLSNVEGNALVGAWQMVDAFCLVATADNPRFDSERFGNWVRETFQGLRDSEGKKV